MMQHKTVIGSPIANQGRERFEDRMRRIAARNLKEASMQITEQNPDSARWYCLHVMKGHEFAVEKELQAADVEAYVPREKALQVRHGRKIEVEKPYLGGYLLVRCVPSSAAFHGLRRQPFVIDMVGGVNGNYYVITDAEVAVFKALFDAIDVSRMPTNKSFADGDKAEVTIGPFTGFSCLVTKVAWCREAWASVLIEVSGRVFPISRIPLAFLKKL
jgi:transcriptional antiterminator NusG